MLKKKKSLGQHFLSNRHYLNMVADAAGVAKGETVVEIGPGEGTLTAVLLERGAKVVALEKDARLIELLRKKFEGKRVEVIEGDALDFNPTTFNLKPHTYTVVGNIPYYITGALLRKFLTEKNQPSTLVFLLQKEVGERIARSKKESILSLSIKAYGTPKYVKTVPRGAFNPPPNVDSAILAVQNISRNHFKDAKHEQKFFELVKKGFSSKRKMLAGNLGKEHSNNLEIVGVSPKARAEDVPLEAWIALSKN